LGWQNTYVFTQNVVFKKKKICKEH
jgi:hypothetical protein